MTIANRYILKQLLLTTGFITIILTLLVWLTQSLRFIDVVISRGFTLQIFFKLILYLLPDLLGILLPIGALLAVLFVYNRLNNDSELIIFRATGFSNLMLAKPAVFLALVVMVIMYLINLYFLPLSFQRFKNLEYDIRNRVGVHMIRAGEFNNFKHFTLYVRSRQKSGELRGILLHDARNPNNQVTLAAEEGVLLETPNGAQIVMLNGNRQEFDSQSGKPRILWFEEYRLDLSTKQEDQDKRQLKPYERFLGDLFDPPDEQINPSFEKRLLAEGHQRILLPLSIVSFILLALNLFLRGDYQRRTRSKRLLIIFSLCTVLEILCLSLLNIVDYAFVTIPLAYSIVLGIGGLAFYGFDRHWQFLDKRLV